MRKNLTLSFPVHKKNSKVYTTETHNWDLSEQLDIDFILTLDEFQSFEKAAKIVKKEGKIGYEILITNPKFIDKGYVLYLLVINGKILKCGKVKSSLDKRSYTAGTVESWVERGTPSEPNYYYSQIFRDCLEKGIEVEFYAMLAPVQKHTYDFMGQNITQYTSPYEECELTLKTALEKLKGGKLIGEGALDEKNKI